MKICLLVFSMYEISLIQVRARCPHATVAPFKTIFLDLLLKLISSGQGLDADSLR